MSYRIAKCKKPHTIAEELILLAAIDMVNIMVGESAGKLLSKVHLFNNTVSRRIHHMAEDLNDQLIEKIKKSEFGLQLDEATDTNKDAHLICYVRFIDGDDMVEDLPFVKILQQALRLRTYLIFLIILCQKICWIGLNMTVFVLTALVPCLAVMENYSHLLETKPLMHCGPIALSIEKHLRQNI